MAVAGLILSAIGVGVSVYGQIQGAKAQKDAEKQRQKQLNLDAARQRRTAVRNAIWAKSQALSTATSQGANFGSGVPGAYGQIEGRTGNELEASGQNQEIGNNIFAANRRAYNASIISDFGSGLTSLGGLFMQDAGTFKRVGQNGYF